MNNQQEIITYIEKKFNPEIIFLGGSRARGTYREKSDWDFYLIGDFPSENKAAPDEYLGEFLDIALFPNGYIDDGIFERFHGPVYDLVVIKDNKNADGERVVKKTKERYLAGPTPYTQEARDARLKHLHRLLSKIVGYSDIPQVAEYHLAKFYRDIFPLWFRAQGKWSISVQYAIGVIREEDAVFSGYIDILASDAGIDKKIRTCTSVFEYFKVKMK